MSEPDRCRPVDVDGQTIRVHGGREMTEQDRAAFAEVVRAVQARMASDEVAKQEGADVERPTAAPSGEGRRRPRSGTLPASPDR